MFDHYRSSRRLLNRRRNWHDHIFLCVSLTQLPRPTRKKRVLLVDTSTAKRDLRAEAMRKLGMDVDCACDIDEARMVAT
jgi:hypothetical protein